MAKKKRERSTRRMPSGAQQYVRPAETGRNTPAADRMRTINNVANRSSAPGLSRQMTDAILDESARARIGDTNERQTRDEDFNNAMRDIRAKRRKEGGAMKSKKSAAPAASKRPMPNPRAVTERGSRHDEGMTREAMERGSSAPSRSPRPTARRKDGGKVKKMAYGGKVAKKAKGGFPDLNKDGKVTKADILQGRGVKKMAMGGKCRGMGAATKGGNYSRG